MLLRRSSGASGHGGALVLFPVFRHGRAVGRRGHLTPVLVRCSFSAPASWAHVSAALHAHVCMLVASLAAALQSQARMLSWRACLPHVMHMHEHSCSSKHACCTTSMHMCVCSWQARLLHIMCSHICYHCKGACCATCTCASAHGKRVFRQRSPFTGNGCGLRRIFPLLSR